MMHELIDPDTGCVVRVCVGRVVIDARHISVGEAREELLIAQRAIQLRLATINNDLDPYTPSRSQGMDS